MRRPARVVPFVCAAIAVAACGGGESALDAGLDDEPAQTESRTEAGQDESIASDDGAAVADEGDGDADAGDGDGGADAGDGSASGESDVAGDAAGQAADGDEASTDGLSEPAPSPLEGLPPCPVDALDTVGDGPIELTMWFGLADQLAGELQALTDAFNASQDQVVVELENQTDYETTIDNYLNLSEANRPDLVMVPEFVVQTFAESDSFVPIEACVEAAGLDTSTFLDRTLVAYSYGGVQWGMPFNVSSPVLYFNKQVFEAAGLDPDDPPQSFDEMRAAAEAIVASGAATFGEVVDVSRDGAGARIEQWLGQLESPFVDGGNGRAARATEARFGGADGLALFTYLRDMRRDELIVSVGENAGGLDAFLKLIDPSEPGAMTVATSAGIVQVIQALGGGIAEGLTEDDIGVGFLPGPDGDVAAQVGGASLWIPAGRGDAETAAAWSYIDFLVSARSQSTWAANTGYVPMRSDALDLDPIATLFADDPRFRVSYDQLAAPVGSIEAARPALGPQREVRQVLADVIATIYRDPSLDDDALAALVADAVEQADALIATYNRLN
ncbi:MAG: extracellular solute-binding protein [Actinomycetota bacterium]